jgi:hypothetical protein
MTSFSHLDVQRPQWRTVVISVLAFWISSSLILDLVIMPTLYASGMMTEANFATAGYSIFWVFNRIELVCAAVVLTGGMILRRQLSTANWQHHWTVLLSLALLSIGLFYTYGLTPEMSALGLPLNLFETATEIPTRMNLMHGEYWVLEVCKLAIGTVLLGNYYKSPVNA